MEPWVVTTGLIFIYLAATVVIGVIANRVSTSTLEDYLLCGRQAGVVLLYLTVVSSYHSAFAFLGAPAFFYTHGVGFWVAGSWSILLGAITYVLGTRIWALGKKFSYTTPADMLADFYESDTVRVVVAFVSVAVTILYIQVQAEGLGYLVSIATGDRLSAEWGTFILLIVAAGYLILGGLRAVYWTDAVQGVWMYLAVWIGALFLAWKLHGGPLQLWERVSLERPDLLSLPGPEGLFTPGMWLGMVVVFSLGIVLQPHMFIRYYTAVNAKTIKWLGATTPIYLMTLFIPAALIGLGGALSVPDIANPDHVFPQLLVTHAPMWLAGIILAGATAATMSTLDSILHANMTVLTRDVYERYIKPDASQAHYVFVGRIIVVGLLGVGYWLAVSSGAFLVDLVAISGVGSLQLLPAFLGVLFPGRFLVTRNAVLVGIVIGIAVSWYCIVVQPHPLGIHGGLWGIAANFVFTAITSLRTQPPRRATMARIHGTIEELVYGEKQGADL